MSKNTQISELVNYISANSSGNVVVAAPTSGYALDVNGTLRTTGASTFLSSITSSDAFISTDGTNTIRLQKAYFGGIDAIYQSGTNAFGIYLGGGTYTAAKLYITNSGNVGIGTTLPAVHGNTGYTTLTITGGTSNRGWLELGTSTASSNNNIFGQISGFNGTNARAGEVRFFDDGAVNKAGIDFAVLNAGSISSAMRIISTGNVGIGLTNPQSQLHINGEMTFSEGGYDTVRLHKIVHSHSDGSNANNYLAFQVSDGGGTTAERMRITGGGHIGIKVTPSNLWGSGMSAVQIGTGGVLSNWTGSNNNFQLGVNYLDNGAGSQLRLYAGGTSKMEFENDVVTFSRATSGLVGSLISWNESMRITGAGSVLVGTTTRSYSESFIVKGSSSSMGVVRFENNVNQGDVNHGTLMVVNTASYAIGNDASIAFALQNSANSFTDPRASIGCKTESPYGGALVFNTRLDGGSYTEKMRINGTGNVGINTTSPTAKLDINGDVRFRGGIYTQYQFTASGAYSSGTWYDVVNSSQLAEGVYILTGYVDTYAVGGGIYFMQFVTVPFYFWGPGCNSVTYTDLPEPIGSGHHKGSALPLFRLQHTNGVDGKLYLKFNPNANWSNIQPGVGGATFNVYLKRIGN